MSTGLQIFTIVHVAISLVGIASGCAVAFGLLTAKRLDGWTMLFLASTAATSVTGFFFPFRGLTPATVVGIVSLLVLAVAEARLPEEARRLGITTQKQSPDLLMVAFLYSEEGV